MGLKNFIREGTYLRLERIGYSKQRRNTDAVLVVYDKDEVILTTQIAVNVHIKSVEITKTITEENKLLEIAPEFLEMKEGDAYYINLPSASTPYIEDINNKIVIKTIDNIYISSPEFIYYPLIKETLERKDGKFTLIKPNEIKTIQQFDNWFNPSNPMKSLYEYIKLLPAYIGCEDE